MRWYEAPVIVDYGSIVDHTFSRCPPAGGPPKDFQQCPLDKFDECSCPDGAVSP